MSSKKRGRGSEQKVEKQFELDLYKPTQLLRFTDRDSK